MKKLPVILSLLATSLMGSSLTNSMEDKPTGGISLGAPSQKFSEFRADFEAMCPSDMSSSPSSLPLSVSSSVPSGQSEFYKEVFKVGTRHQYAATLSEQDEIERALEESRREAEFAKQEREALEASQNLILEELRRKEITSLEDQIGTLNDLRDYLFQNRDNLHDSLIATIPKKYAYGATDTAETRAAATIEYDMIDKELNDSRAEYAAVSDQLSDLRLKSIELKYGSRLPIPAASSEHLPSGIGGPSGVVLPPIPSSALPTTNGID